MRGKDREQAIADLTAEGWPLADIRSVLRDAATLTRLAELACSSEAADRDRVPCPRLPAWPHHRGQCVCQNYGSFAHETSTHGQVPRYMVRERAAEIRVANRAAAHGATVKFNGDPRGYVVKLGLPSGRYNTWGGKGEGYGIG